MSSNQIPNEFRSNFKVNYQSTKSNMSNMIIIYQINNVIQCNQISYNQLGIYLHDHIVTLYINAI